MKHLLFAIIGALLGAFFSPAAWAQETSWSTTLHTVIDADHKVYARIVSPTSQGYLKAAVSGMTEIDMRNGSGTAVGVYAQASGRNIPTTGHRELVGVYARVDKTGQTWGAALHGECYDWVAAYTGGTCIGANVEMKTPAVGSEAIAINAQADPGARGVIGLQIQEASPEGASNWARVTRFPAGWHSLGSVDGVEFCTRFTGRTQRFQWVRGAPLCDSPEAIVIHEVNMNWAPGLPLANR